MLKKEKAIKYVLKNEGGYSNNKNDKGGETNFGISARFLSDLPDKEPLKIKPLKSFTVQDAISIYDNYIWSFSVCEKIKDERLSVKLFDTIVNIGKFHAYLLIQKACNFPLPDNSKLKEDGILGKESISQINHFPGSVLIKTYADKIFYYYEEIVKKNPSQKQFLVGWQQRALKIPYEQI